MSAKNKAKKQSVRKTARPRQKASETKQLETRRSLRHKAESGIFAPYMAMIHTIPDILYFKDINSRHLVVNKAFAEFVGLEEADIVGKTNKQLFPPNLAGYFSKSDQEVIKNNKTIRYEEELLHKSGEKMFFDTIKSPVCDEMGNIVGLAGVMRDITEHKRVEGVLINERNYLEKLHNSLGDAVFSVKMPERLISFANNAVESIFGHRPWECIGRSTEIFYPDKESFLDFGRKLHDAITQGKDIVRIEHLLKRGKNEIFPANITTTVLRQNGQVTDVISIVRDITGLKQKEEEIHKLNKELEHRVIERTEQQTAALELSQLALTGVGLTTLINEAVNLVARTLKVEYCKVLELLPGGNSLILRAGVGWKEGMVGSATVSAGADSQAGYTLLANGPVIVEDLNTETRFHGPPLLLNHGVVSGISVIIPAREKPFGVLGAHTIRRRTFTWGDINFLQAVANVLAVAIERKLSEETLQKSEASLADAQRIAHLGNWDWDIVNNTLRWSDEIYHIFGLTPQQFGATYEAFVDSVHLDDREFVKKSVYKALYEKEPYDIDYRIVLPDGVERIVHAQAEVTFDVGGKPIHMAGVVQDITERKQVEKALQESENNYRNIIRYSKDAIFKVRNDKTITYASPACFDIFGYTPEEFMTNPELGVKIIHPDSHAQFLEFWDNYARTKTFSNKLCEWACIRKDNKTVYTENIFTNIYNDAGDVIGFQTIAREVTERKKMEQELAKMDKLESVGILAGGIAHDFNNLLTAIVGNISLAKMRAGSEDKNLKMLIEAEKACFRAKELTQQLLTFSKGGAPIKKATHIGELVKDSAGFTLSGSMTRPEFYIVDNLWPVEVDEGQISQVINNLILNADQAMPEGGIIEVRCENIVLGKEDTLPLTRGRYIKITVKDQGCGIAKEHLEKIFDPYFTTKKKGSGLGLSTTYSIIKKHDGHIAVESELGKGTAFYIYLPASEKEVSKEKGAEEEHIAGKGRILVMDDEEVVREVAGGMAAHLGYEVDFAEDGAKAIELYKKAKKSGRSFDVVIMDLTIPGGMGGEEAMKKLLEIDPSVKVIVSSGYSNDPVMADYKKHGFSGVIAKPYKIAEMSSVINSVIYGTDD